MQHFSQIVPRVCSTSVLFIFVVIWQFSFRISNAAITCLLHFLRWFVSAIGQSFQTHTITEMGNSIPVTLTSLHRLIALEINDFSKYVVCPSCNSIYEYSDCVEVKRNGEKISKRCQHVHYPNHSQKSRRKECEAILLKKVKKKNGHVLTPIKVYPYKSLQKSIEQLVRRDGFLASCEKWRNRSVPDGYLYDIYDGRIWKRYNSAEGLHFLCSPHSWLLTLNVDWFEPFERGVYSVGAIYMCIQNLPRDVRYRSENIILVGIMPGPKEAKKTINSFLTPLVFELQEAWNHGFSAMSPQNIPVRIKLALSCVTCDIPASRKVCGFLSHNASLGCNKCLKRFPCNFGERTNYSGFIPEEWEQRNLEQHHRGLSAISKAVTKSGINLAESQFGVRYSILLALPYFDPVTFTAIDSMHNLFLGTGKHMFSLWVERDILTKEKMSILSNKIKMFSVPVGIGRLPSSISSSYGAYTASQWKNWITIYSPVVLKGLLLQEDFRCWLLFVRACSLLCSNCIKKADVLSADLYLVHFCRKVEELYGPTSCTFNMHLHMHLKENFLDYGPPHATWCFAFERFNGILGSYHTNKKEIEPQIMRKFSQNQGIHRLDLTSNEMFQSLLPTSYQRPLNNTVHFDSLNLLHYAHSRLERIHTFAFEKTQQIALIPPFLEGVLNFDVCEKLENIYSLLYPDCDFQPMSKFYQKFGRITIGDDLIGSDMPGPNGKSSSVIMAYWPGSSETLDNIDYNQMSIGVVQYYIRHVISYVSEGTSKKVEYIFAYVLWKEKHHHFDWFGASASLCCNSFEAISTSRFLPVQRIGARCATTITAIDFGDSTETVFIASPIPLSYCH